MNDLLRLALLGTARQPVDAEASSHAPDQLVGQCPIESRERKLLLRAGAWATYSLAGYQPERYEQVIASCPEEERPSLSPRAAELLMDLLNRKWDQPLAEAFQLIAENGLCIPHAMLPAVMAIHKVKALGIPESILGQRGRWLCQFNESWSKVFQSLTTNTVYKDIAEAEKIWSEGTLAQRKQVLSEVRKMEPDRARQWLESVWNQEKADTRLELIELLASGLSSSDTPFLDQALGDSSKFVRAVAARLLCQLPDSALFQRLLSLAETMLAFDPKSAKLSIAPPQEFEKKWEKDGIQEKPPNGVGKRAHWLRQVMEKIPPTHWEKKFSVSPEQLLQAARDDEFGQVLIEAWSEAVRFFKSSAWASALWNYWEPWVERKNNGEDFFRRIQMLTKLLEILPTTESHERILKLLAKSANEANPTFCHVVTNLPRPWPRLLAHAYIRTVRKVVESTGTDTTSHWASTLDTAGHAIPPECFSEALEPWTTQPSTNYVVNYLHTRVKEFTDVVQHRSDFRNAIQAKL